MSDLSSELAALPTPRTEALSEEHRSWSHFTIRCYEDLEFLARTLERERALLLKRVAAYTDAVDAVSRYREQQYRPHDFEELTRLTRAESIALASLRAAQAYMEGT